MSEIRSRQENPAPQILYTEIFFPDHEDLGTGTFSMVVQEHAFDEKRKIVGGVNNPPKFQLSVNINLQSEEIPVLIGHSDPETREVFYLPGYTDPEDQHEFELEFEDWEITSLTMDNLELSRQSDE